MAPTHAAVRLLGQGAMTMHKAAQAKFNQKWTPEYLNLTGESAREMKLRWCRARATILDEMSMAAPEVYHALGYRIAHARYFEKELNINLKEYATQWFGNMPIGIQLGDFMQLRPAARRSLCEWIIEGDHTVEELTSHLESTASEMGRTMFQRSFTHVVQFHGTGRFSACQDGQDLVQLLTCMREGKPLSDELWAKLKMQEVNLESTDRRLEEARRQDAHEGAFIWEIVARLQHLRAMRDASTAGKRLYYVQAVDHYLNNVHPLSRAETFEALQVVSMTNTGLLMGMVPLFQGMQVRVSANVHQNALLTRELVGTVVGIQLHSKEPKAHSSDASASQEPCILNYLPACVLVKLEDAHLKETLFSADLDPGVIALEPQLASWIWHREVPSAGHRTGRKPVESKMHRYQIPLCPRKVNTHFGLQGQTARDGLIAFLQKPPKQSAGDYFLGVYVMLSRVTKLSDLLIVDLPERSLFESTDGQGLGTLLTLQKRMKYFQAQAVEGKEKSAQIMKLLGWEENLSYDLKEALL